MGQAETGEVDCRAGMGPVRGASQWLAGQRESGAFAADETPHVFTLTPARSLRGSGRRFAARSCIRTVRRFETRSAGFPLPADPGRGEGERQRKNRWVPTPQHPPPRSPRAAVRGPGEAVEPELPWACPGGAAEGSRWAASTAGRGAPTGPAARTPRAPAGRMNATLSTRVSCVPPGRSSLRGLSGGCAALPTGYLHPRLRRVPVADVRGG